MASTSTASTSSMTVIASPTPAMAQTTTTRTASASEQAQRRYDPVDEFFGYRFATSATHESRHDSTRASVALESDVPPPYAAEDTSLPAYTAFAEPITLAMYLFKFGFLFFPFWIFGAFILISPLREPPTSEASPVWMPEKTEAERQELIAQMRKVELKWAKRCLYAIIIFLMLAAVAAVAVWALLLRKN